MKKLNQAELNILAERIKKKIETEAKAAQIEADEIADEKNDKAATAALQQLKKLGPLAKRYIDTGRYSGVFKNLCKEDILRSMRKSQQKVTKGLGYSGKTEIYESLVLGQIECDNLDELVNRVTKEFVR